MMSVASRDSPDSPDSHIPSGTVELREDVPLKSRAGAGGDAAWRWCAARGGPRLMLAAFGALSAAITLALLTQIYAGDYQVAPHGSVSSSAAACSSAGTDALKAGGRALDAALAAALCLAVLAPHRTSLDASGAMLYWEYREARTQPAVLYEWGGPGAGADAGAGAGAGTGAGASAGADSGAGAVSPRAPRLLAALAALHARHGALPWGQLVAPALQLARDGFPVSAGLALAASEAEGVDAGEGAALPVAGRNATAPQLARYLAALLHNTSAELSSAWQGEATVVASTPLERRAGGWRVLAGGAGASRALAALAAALQPPPADADLAQRRVVSALQLAAIEGGWPPAPGGVASGLAVVDPKDTYLALVTGLSRPFGSGPATAEGWSRDEPAEPLDLAPALLLDGTVCGTRYVIGAESSGALAQGGAALALGGAAGAERARVALVAGGALALEAARAPLAPAALPAPPTANATPPYPALNLVLQRGDALLSHADSRGGGLASRF